MNKDTIYVTNDLDNLVDALRHMPYTSPRTIAQTLNDNGVVRVLDPDDDELRKHVAHQIAMAKAEPGKSPTYGAMARAAIEALRQS